MPICALQEGYDFFQRWTAEPNFPRYLVLQVTRTRSSLSSGLGLLTIALPPTSPWPSLFFEPHPS